MDRLLTIERERKEILRQHKASLTSTGINDARLAMSSGDESHCLKTSLGIEHNDTSWYQRKGKVEEVKQAYGRWPRHEFESVAFSGAILEQLNKERSDNGESTQ